MDKKRLAATIERGWSSRKKNFLKEESDAQAKTGEGTMSPEEESQMQAKDSEVGGWMDEKVILAFLARKRRRNKAFSRKVVTQFPVRRCGQASRPKRQ